MASLRKENDRGRVGWRLQFRQGEKRRSLWLGPMSKRAADTVSRHIEELVCASTANVTPAAEAESWLALLDGRIHTTLVKWGLARPKRVIPVEQRICSTFFASHLADRSDWDSRTKNNYQQAIGWFLKRFGENKHIESVTLAEFDSWHRWMVSSGLAQSTANKHAKRLRTLFNVAMRSKLLTENPASGTRIGGEVNRDRDHYIGRADADLIIAKSDIEWSLIFGLCRFAGFRCPTEVLDLKWSDVQWDDQRLWVDSTKTGLRFCPIFPELKQLLNDAWDAAPEGAIYVIRHYRDRTANLRTQLKRIVESAGLTIWEKPFVNLRASCRTDLEERFPSHVIDSWLGHSTKVAQKHYLQVTEAHWERAVTEADSSNLGGVIGADLGQSTSPSEEPDPQESLALIGAEYPSDDNRHPRKDSNLCFWTESPAS